MLLYKHAVQTQLLSYAKNWKTLFENHHRLGRSGPQVNLNIFMAPNITSIPPLIRIKNTQRVILCSAQLILAILNKQQYRWLHDETKFFEIS